ncbi:serine carboxypeptidase-like isoform X2 [Vicia villosa]|nr:serine carboxypeptidase-like isoform X2 [Vicia villosa]XP_058729753.1 serine carboxypeptidase-like isoform X2 [Vicia villosa]
MIVLVSSLFDFWITCYKHNDLDHLLLSQFVFTNMGFPKTSFSLLSFFILLSSSYATSRFTLQQGFSPNRQDDFVPGKIVEKTFSFLASSDGTSVEDLGHHAGFYSLPRSKSARMFYVFIESRNGAKDAPLMLWLTGGPRCASAFAMFRENGPFQINNDSSLSPSAYGWDKVSNMIFVDQCIGRGYSYSSDKNDIRTDEISVSNDLYDFMQAFLKEHPQFVKNDFYISGESYAGQYIPVLASRILEGNENKEGNTINLKGIAIGNGLINPRIQYPADIQFAVDNKLITKEDQTDINKLVPSCVDAIKTCENEGGDSCRTAYQCEKIVSSILSIAVNINYYNTKKKCEGPLCYDFSNVETLLNKQAVRDGFGVGNTEFVSCSNAMPNALNQYSMRNNDVYIPALLEGGIKVLIYAGEYDLICNWFGNSQWVHAMKWSGQEQFGASETVSFLVDGKTAGLLNSHGPLSFLKVNDSGHLVPMDQPKVALKMMVNWMQGNLNVGNI